MATATTAQVKAAAVRWLDAPHYTMVVRPFPTLVPGETTLNRQTVPPLGEAPAVSFPAVQRTTLKNGLSVVLLERHSTPIVNVALAVDAGYAADDAAKAGLAALALNLLDDGTTTRDAFRVVDELDALGAQLTTRNSLDLSFVRLQALPANLAPSLQLMADVVAQPGVPGRSGRAEKRRQLAADRPGEGRSAAGWRCASCRGSSTARRTPTPTRSPAPARRRRSSRSPATTCCAGTARGSRRTGAR